MKKGKGKREKKQKIAYTNIVDFKIILEPKIITKTPNQGQGESTRDCIHISQSEIRSDEASSFQRQLATQNGKGPVLGGRGRGGVAFGGERHLVTGGKPIQHAQLHFLVWGRIQTPVQPLSPSSSSNSSLLYQRLLTPAFSDPLKPSQPQPQPQQQQQQQQP